MTGPIRFASYWHDTMPAFDHGQQGPVAGRFDTAIIGGGFTGLSAALTLARAGQRVALLEAGGLGHGASGRNGGHLNNGIAHDYPAAVAHLGADQAAGLYRAYDASIDLIERIIADEGIECGFRRSGKLKLASKPSHVAGLRANFQALNAGVDPQTEWLDRAALTSEIGSDSFHGAILYRRSAMMDMGRYVTGLGTAAARHGAQIWENARVTARAPKDGGWQLTTPRGSLQAQRVILATDAYTDGLFPFFRRRMLTVGSFLLTTRPLSADEVARTLPGERTCVTSMNIGNYFRLTPDRRLLFGGRARFTAQSDTQADARSGAILQRALAGIFPHLAGIGIDHCWGGLVGMTPDRYPRAGQADGVLYALGYSGHGAQISTLMGTVLARMALGLPADNPVEGLPLTPVPLHGARRWFLPVVGAWYGARDRLS
ncbi:FAD-binding oxidoreductase [Paracoccus nototheniae]|uniref:NAD(P)/FAD-dependent oxidoreductase n=1 Tax=Paracoccus nototheniae TaxID=2489002 RepID=A0ABW4DTT5_9RHOB|nr:FAD-binding oxidoreductase [Paracoccus nototheniae]